MSEAVQPMFAIERVYVKDLSLEVPNAPEVFFQQGQPQIDVQMRTDHKALSADQHSVILTVTVTAKLGDKTLFLIEVGQGGVFRIANVDAQMLQAVLAITCPNLLFPYAREVISDASMRGGFPPVVLQPVNFEMLYQQQAMQQAAPEAAPAPAAAGGATH
jgi:preprotein translocase subunit SecB